MVLLSKAQLLTTILAIALGTVLTRFLPFILFRSQTCIPPSIGRLQIILPSAAMASLVVYALKDLDLTTGSRGLPEFISLAVIILCHYLFQKDLLSIGVGTLTYMFLIQKVFV